MQKGEGRELCLATDRRNKQLFLARFLLKTNANSRLPTWFPNPKQYRGQMCLIGPNTCSFSVSCSELWHCSLPEPRRPCALWNTKKERPAPILFSIFNTGMAATTSYNNQPELYLKFAPEGCFWQWGGISAHLQVGFWIWRHPRLKY